MSELQWTSKTNVFFYLQLLTAQHEAELLSRRLAELEQKMHDVSAYKVGFLILACMHGMVIGWSIPGWVICGLPVDGPAYAAHGVNSGMMVLMGWPIASQGQ